MDHFRTKLLYTAVIYFLFLQLALRYGICGPSLTDLRDNLRVSTNDVSISVSIMCAGICLGAISSGFLLKLLSRELLTFFLILLTSGFVATITYIQSYTLFLLWNLLVGITSGASISLCESWILELWGRQCGPYMQALQLFRGLGYIIAPILADPFLSKALPFTEVSPGFVNLTTPTNSTKLQALITVSRIQTPYLLNSIMLFLGALFLLALYLSKLFRSKSDSSLSQGISKEEILGCEIKVQPALLNSRARLFSAAFIILSSLFYLFFYEEVIVIFLPTFALNLQLRLSKSGASKLTTAFSLANVLGKGVAVLLALKMSHLRILYTNLALMIASLGIILAYGNVSVSLLWLGVCLHGIGLSSIIACLYTLLETSITVSPSICGLLNMMGTLGSVILPLLIGQHLDHRPMVLIYACLVCAFGCLGIFLIMHLLLLNKARLIAGEEKEKPTIEAQKEHFQNTKCQFSVNK